MGDKGAAVLHPLLFVLSGVILLCGLAGGTFLVFWDAVIEFLELQRGTPDPEAASKSLAPSFIVGHAVAFIGFLATAILSARQPGRAAKGAIGVYVIGVGALASFCLFALSEFEHLVVIWGLGEWIVCTLLMIPAFLTGCRASSIHLPAPRADN